MSPVSESAEEHAASSWGPQADSANPSGLPAAQQAQRRSWAAHGTRYIFDCPIRLTETEQLDAVACWSIPMLLTIWQMCCTGYLQQQILHVCCCEALHGQPR